MNRLSYLLLAFATLMAGCSRQDTFTLKGNIGGLSSDTLLAYYHLPDYKLDTIVAKKGTFTYTIAPDTFTIFTLVLPGGESLPVYADKGGKVTLQGTAGQLQAEGDGENAVLAQVRRRLDGLEAASPDSLMNVVDSLLKARPQSYTALYLIDKYYVQAASTDYNHIDELIKGLDGAIKDTPYMADLQNKLEENTHLANGNFVSDLSCTDKDGKLIGWSSLRNRYVLLDFWASWDKESVTAQDSLASVQKALKKEKFVIVSLSLDLDRKAWLKETERRDTTQWRQVCDFKGWENNVVKRQNIRRLPANMLIGPDKRIVARDLRGKELTDRVKELIKQDKEKEKAAKEAERLRKRQNKK